MLHGNENEVEFKVLGETVRVETNHLGNVLRVYFGDLEIVDESGNDVWRDGIDPRLSGAARISAMEKVLKDEGEGAIYRHIIDMHLLVEDLREELNEIEDSE